MFIKGYIKTMRIPQWIKNSLIFAALIFANRLGEIHDWLLAGLAFIAFSLIASSLYIVNDLIDKEKDAHHPVKKNRPIASGKVKPAGAITLAAMCAVGGLGIGLINHKLLTILISYIVLQVFYNLILKHKMLADVICIAIGFVLRAIAGAVIINVEISEWLVICTFCLCLFLGFCKRYNETKTIGQELSIKNHRKTLDGYTSTLLTHLITLSATLAIVTFLLYSTSSETIAKFGTNAFIYTLPVIIYCICRAAMLSMNGAYSGPTELMLKDKGLILGIIIWFIMIVLIILYPDKISYFL